MTMAAIDLPPTITTRHITIPPPPQVTAIPTFEFHLTRLKGTLMVWVGTSTSSSSDGLGPDFGGGGVMDDDMSHEPEAGGSGRKVDKRLGSDWALAMPSRGKLPGSATSIYQTGASSVAIPMSQRLSRRFPSHQIHLSLSLPPALTAPSGVAVDPMAGRTLILMEKKLTAWLERVLEEEQER